MAAYPKVRCIQGQATIAQVNAGLTLVAGSSGRTLTVVDGWLRSIGGAVGTATTVDVESTNATPVLAFKMAAAALTENAVARMGLATHSTNTGIGTALGADDGIALTATGTIDTATHIDYCVFYTVTPS